MKNCKYNYLYLAFLIVFIISCNTSRQSKKGNDYAKQDRPNILLILSDDMGYSDLHSYGSIHIRTPNLDQLAMTGLRYTDFHNVPHCAPSRAALLTGLYPTQTGEGWMPGRKFDLPGYIGELNNHSVTIAEVLKQAGYATYMTGKWHLAYNTKPHGPKYDWPLQRGFDKFYGIITGASNYYDPATLTRGNTMMSAFNDPLYHPDHYYFTTAITANTIRFLQQRSKDKPFFMYVAYTAAHWPMQAPKKAIEQYEGAFDAGWGVLRRKRYKRMKKIGVISDNQPLSPLDTHPWSQEKNKEAMARRMETYAAMITIMDQGIGRIVDELKKEGVFDNTVIFYLQDNGGNAEGTGYGKGPHGKTVPIARDTSNLTPLKPDQIQPDISPPITRNGKAGMGKIVKVGKKVMAGPADTYLAYLKPWANLSNTPFRGYKNFAYEGGTSTPLIVHWPAGIDQKYEGEFRRQVSHVIDIMPTIVELTDATYPETFQEHSIHPMAGVSLVPTFSDQSLKPRALFWSHQAQRAVRMGKWKLDSPAYLHGGYGRWKSYTPLLWELYNMNVDRAETRDVSAEHPELVKKMAKKWEEWAHQVHVFPRPWKKKPPPARKDYMSTPWSYPDF